MSGLDTHIGLLAASFAAGAAVGLGYFVGLWRTVARLPGSGRPVALAVLSFALRFGLALAALWLAAGGQPARLGACVAGFVLARVVLQRRLGPTRCKEAT